MTGEVTLEEARARKALREAVARYWGLDKVSGASPHPETLAAVVDGVIDVIALSQQRSPEYASEPWLQQSIEDHLEHSTEHFARASSAAVLNCVTHSIIDDDRFPHTTHAMMRLMFANRMMRRVGVIGPDGTVPFGYPNK